MGYIVVMINIIFFEAWVLQQWYLPSTKQTICLFVDDHACNKLDII